jgi:hypothetical protein
MNADVGGSNPPITTKFFKTRFSLCFCGFFVFTSFSLWKNTMNRCLLRPSALLSAPAPLGEQARQNPKTYKHLEHAQRA